MNECHNAALMPVPQPSTQDPSGASAVKPSAVAVMLIMAPLCLSALLSSLDLTMVTPAIPSIAADFHSSSSYVWVGGAFTLASTAMTPIWGTIAE